MRRISQSPRPGPRGRSPSRWSASWCSHRRRRLARRRRLDGSASGRQPAPGDGDGKKRRQRRPERPRKFYVVQPGDTPELDRREDRGLARAAAAAEPRRRPADPDRPGEKLQAALRRALPGAGSRLFAAAPARCSRCCAPAPPRRSDRTAPPPELDARAWTLSTPAPARRSPARRRTRGVPIASTTKLMTAYLALKELPLRRRSCAPPPTAAIPGESLLGLTRRGAGQRSRPALRADPAQRQRRRAHPRRRGRPAPSRRFVREMNLRAAALGLADTHYSNPIGLDEAGQLLERPRPRRAQPAAARDPVFAPHRRLRRARRCAACDPPRTIDTRNTLLLRGALGHRGEDRPHARRRLRAGRLGAARRASS